MKTARLHPNPEKSLESLFSAKYPWLLRWALHFAQNDRAAAEDLIQETFVRILLIWDTLLDLDNLEPLLYTHLRYAHLTERRRGRAHTLQSLSTVDFDTLVIGLRASSSFDQLEAQNELRRILVFLLWRRHSAKFASIFLLRFFHGFTPEEIALLCRISRHAVDLGLGRARSELRSYLADPAKIQVVGRGGVPDTKLGNFAAAPDEFVHELRTTIFASRFGQCLTVSEWERYDRAALHTSLGIESIAHLVCCASCLEKAARHGGAPPPSTRSMEDSVRPMRKPSRSSRLIASEKASVMRLLSQGKNRMREIQEHRPSGLVIALNSEVAAVRDISSPHAFLKVETRGAETLEMIEIFSEQGVLMHALALVDRPPQSPPEIRCMVTLSDDRTLTLVVCFTADGAVIEVTYVDPHFVETIVYLGADEADTDAADNSQLWHEPSENSLLAGPKSIQWPKWLKKLIFWPRPVVAIAVSVALLGVVLWFTMRHEKTPINAVSLLENATRTERASRVAHADEFVHQQIRIRAQGRSLQRDLYRDLSGRRRPKTRPMDPDERTLQAKLAITDMDWNDPLSAADFVAWHDHAPMIHDEVTHPGPNLVTVTTTSSGGSVLRESLTVRLSDLHPIDRTLLFNDHEQVEIAEVSYDLLPWSKASDAWFEPVETHLPAPTHRFPSVAANDLNQGQIDLAQLGAMLALQELHAESERLQVTQNERGVIVRGVVETEDRKRELVARLQTIPHVSVEILSYRDFETKPEMASSATAVKSLSVVTGQSPLAAYCDGEHLPHDRCQRLAYSILNASGTLVQYSNRLRELQQQYPATRPISSTAHGLLAQLMRQYIDHLSAAIQEEDQALPALGIHADSDAETATDRALRDGSFTLADAISRNAATARELAYANEGSSRSAPIILQDLASSARQVHAAISRIPIPAASRAEASSGDLTLHHD